MAASPLDPARAIERALAIEADGADIIDIGAESTRPGADAVDAAGGVARGCARSSRAWPRRLRVPISVDTYKAETARRALDAGVAIVNDISGLGYDAAPRARSSRARGAALVLMHTRGRSRDMYAKRDYDDVVA